MDSRTNISTFLVFDAIVPKFEGAEPRVLYCYSVEPMQPHQDVNQAGLFIAFLKFCTRFRCASPCDYIETGNYQNGLLELRDNVWMAIRRKKNDNSANHTFIKFLLQNCREMFNLFFPQLTRDPETNEIDEKSTNLIKSAFASIVKSTINTDLTIAHLYNSTFNLTIPFEMEDNLSQHIYNLLHQRLSPIMGIAIMYSYYFIYSSFPPDISRTISLALRVKLPYLFPQALAKEDKKLYWTIGMCYQPDGQLCVFAPPLYINGHQFPLIALRFGKIRFIIALKENVLVSPESLNYIPHYIKPLKHFFESFNVRTIAGKYKGPYLLVNSNKQDQCLKFAYHKLAEHDIPLTQDLLLTCNSFASDFSTYSSIALCGKSNFFVWYRNLRMKEVAIIMKTDCKEVSNAIKWCRTLDDDKNLSHMEVKR
ncbi:vacuolar fusion CCZ1 -like protein [Histomonas meleagridis]|uniref:vacuolar fusion CCZ1 -like protein n=1 Tax=Histomonas meleagridis TaxID=135588 RepID=UPI00355A6480|nr:vacuolar fusion CCZ1 -like protein [Histomonas meleagridis]KAH0805507.1 vacuolar fusion CCZ1 -like protein [Histomonas meleagridis]